MAHARLSSLLVIALLQLSQTEISSTLPESWYAANVINDGSYSPKPISEIFTTQPTFSSTNPIVVLSSSPPPVPSPPPSPSAPPSASGPVPTSTVSSTVSSTEKPATEVSVVPLPTEPPAAPAPERPRPVPPVVAERQTSRPPRFPELSLYQQPPSPPSPPPIVSTPQRIQVQTAPQGTSPPSLSGQNQPPNYFLLYQQAPQTIQNYPSGPPIISLPPLESTSSPRPPTTSSTLRPTVASSLPPKVTSTTLPPSASSRAPCATGAPQASTQLPSFRIRLVAPSGSVTNVRINPEPSTSTTRRPATTRTRKRNKNTYDGCVGGCGGHKIPICASPLGVSPVDPDALKGFPSVCHMACHNSYRKNLYEKVMDGKCGRLRTRIRPAGGGKLTRDNLNKAHYTIVQDGPAVLEFQPLGS